MRKHSKLTQAGVLSSQKHAKQVFRNVGRPHGFETMKRLFPECGSVKNDGGTWLKCQPIVYFDPFANLDGSGALVYEVVYKRGKFPAEIYGNPI